MLIVLEGVDGAGKSTLACNLARCTGFELVHCNKRRRYTQEEFAEVVYLSKKRDIIADRFCYSPFIYLPKKEWSMSLKELRELEIYLLKCGAKIIYVTAEAKEIEKRLKKRNEEPKISTKEAQEEYDWLWNKCLITPQVWDTSAKIEIITD